MVLVPSTIASNDLISVEQELVDIYRRAYSSMPFYAYTKQAEIEHYLHWLKKRAREGFLVAHVGPRPVGFIAVDDSWHTWYGEEVGEIHEFVVDPAFQGQGIGKQLLRAGIEFLKKHGARKIELWVGEKNEKAQCFYRREGFREEGKWGKWIRMLKDLAREGA